MANGKCSYTGKDKHTKGSAISAALRYSKRRGTPLRIYFCHRCASHHLTKRPSWGYSDNLSREEDSYEVAT